MLEASLDVNLTVVGGHETPTKIRVEKRKWYVQWIESEVLMNGVFYIINSKEWRKSRKVCKSHDNSNSYRGAGRYFCRRASPIICYIAIDGSFKLGGCVAFQTSSFEMPETFNQCRELRMYGSGVKLPVQVHQIFIVSIYLKAHPLLFPLIRAIPRPPKHCFIDLWHIPHKWNRLLERSQQNR